MTRDADHGQLQIIEVIMAATILFIAIAIAAVFRLPVSPGTFQSAELERLAGDTLQVLAGTSPAESARCEEVPFQGTSQLERMLSLALGYVGDCPEDVRDPDRAPLADFLNQALPEGVQYIVHYSNAVETIPVVPQGRVPPILDVSVAHFLLVPNWAHYSANVSDSVLVRIGEPTGFGGATEIRDPLNRRQNEFNDPWADLFQARVADNAVLGTYRVCFGGDCHFVSITPPGIVGPGAPILRGDRDNATSIVELGGFFSRVAYYDENGDGFFDFDEPLYVWVVEDSVVSAGDLRLVSISDCPTVGSACRAGTFVEAGDSDAGRPLSPLPAADAQLRQGTVAGSELVGIYLAADPAAAAEADRRLSRIGVHPMGSSIGPDDTDLGVALGPVSTPRIFFDDANGNGALDAGESVYLNVLNEEGLGEGDIHLTSKGHPTVRYFYDVRLVVWFGI